VPPGARWWPAALPRCREGEEGEVQVVEWVMIDVARGGASREKMVQVVLGHRVGWWDGATC